MTFKNKLLAGVSALALMTAACDSPRDEANEANVTAVEANADAQIATAEAEKEEAK